MSRLLNFIVSIVVTGVCVLLIVAPLETTVHSHLHPASAFYDISWPNCTQNTSKLGGMGIVGVNDGVEFKFNPCLSQETTIFSSYSLYLNTSYPGERYAMQYSGKPFVCSTDDMECLAYDYGYNDGLASVNYARLHNAHSWVWFLDVETANDWTSNPFVNQSEIDGLTAAIEAKMPFAKIAFYSTDYQWKQIVGSWDNGLPVWLGTGATNVNDASSGCKSLGFTGGRVLLTQYTVMFDQEQACVSNLARYMKM